MAEPKEKVTRNDSNLQRPALPAEKRGNVQGGKSEGVTPPKPARVPDKPKH